MESTNKKFKAYIMPHSHLDLTWLGTQEECLSRGNRIILKSVELCEKDENFRFFLEDMVFVHHFLKCYPQEKERLSKLVKEGKIELGAKWVGIYQNFQQGEDLVRNTVYAVKFIKETFGVNPKTSHLGDLPGYTPQYPQILTKCNVTTVFITRGGPDNIPLYWWKSFDGSKVLTWYSRRGYGWGIQFGLHENIEVVKKALWNRIDFVESIKQIQKLTTGPVIIPTGEDLIVLPDNFCDTIREWNKTSKEVELFIVTPSEFFDIARNTPDLPTLSGEIPSLWPYTESTYTDITRLDLPAVNLLLIAEKFNTISHILGFIEYPEEDLKESWKRLLKSMDHNFDGIGALMGNQRKKEDKQRVLLTSDELLRKAIMPIAENVEIIGSEEVFPIVVFNQLSWQRNGLVQAHITFYGKTRAFDFVKYRDIVLKDNKGNIMPFQHIDIREGCSREITILFHAEKIPSIGYKTYYIEPKSGSRNEIGYEICSNVVSEDKDIVLENKYFNVRINKLTGRINIFDKEIGLEIIKNAEIECIEEKEDNFFMKDYTTGRTFSNEIESIDLVENGPIRTGVIIKGRICNSPLQQEIHLFSFEKKILILNTINFEDDERPLRIQQVFPFGIPLPEINYGIPYGVNNFNNLQENIKSQHSDEIPSETWLKYREIQGWVDFSNNKYGITISSDLREIEVEDRILKAHMVRGTGTIKQLNEKNEFKKHIWYPPKETYGFKFCIRPHRSNSKETRSYHDGWELNNPLIPITVNNTIGKKLLPSEQSFCSLSVDNIMLPVIKKTDYDNSITLRCYETEGKKTETKLSFFRQISRITETDLLEEELKSVDYNAIEVQPYEIKTLKLFFK